MGAVGILSVPVALLATLCVSDRHRKRFYRKYWVLPQFCFLWLVFVSGTVVILYVPQIMADTIGITATHYYIVYIRTTWFHTDQDAEECTCLSTLLQHSWKGSNIYRYDINPMAFDYLWINTNGYGCLDLHTLLAIPACSADVLVPHFFPSTHTRMYTSSITPKK